MLKRILLLFCLVTLATALLSANSGKRAIPAQGVAGIAADVAQTVPDAAAQNDAVTAQNVADAPKLIAFTFDDGPHRGSTDRLLDGLRERGAKGTFFLVGQEIDEARDLVERMRDEGHQIGNHTWSHKRLDELSPDEIAQEIGKTDALLKTVAGKGEYWLRPPYGFLRPGTENLVGVPVVKWSVDPRDWESRNAPKIIRAVTDAVQPGSIVLLHDIYPTSVEAALQLIDALSADGYQFVTVEELLRRNGVTPAPGVSYRSGDLQ
ncbi:MAG: polysaccharide deacetylase family protein [Oscillibacter sp.]|nr:polysaccharide deacetylase family protein [Oscillibacter sp.]